MDINLLICYTERHETSRKPCAAGEPPPQSHPVARPGHDCDGNSQSSEVFDKLRSPVAASLSEKRRRGAGAEESFGPAGQALLCSETEARRSSARGAHGVWLFHESLDNPSGSRSDSKGIRNSLSRQPHLASLDGLGLELPEAGATSAREGRNGDRGMAEEAVAGHKKKLVYLGPIWRFWMKVDLCSFRRSGRLGRHEDRRPW